LAIDHHIQVEVEQGVDPHAALFLFANRRGHPRAAALLFPPVRQAGK